MSIYQTIRTDDIDKVKEYIKNHPNTAEYINKKEDFSGKTALHIAIIKRNHLIVNYLLNHGADPNIKTKDQIPPLILTILYLDNDIDFRVKTEVELNMIDKNGAEITNTEKIIIKNLLSFGADPNMPDSLQTIILHKLPYYFGTSYETMKEIVDLLVTYNVNINYRGNIHGNFNIEENINNIGSVTPLHEAIIVDNVELIALFLKNKANPNIGSHLGETPLHTITNYKLIQDEYMEVMVEILLKYNANPNLEYHPIDKKNYLACKMTPLHNICSNDNPNLHIVNALLKKRADINKQDSNGDTPLHLLLIQQIDDNYENTSENVIKTIDLLFKHKYNMNLKNNDRDDVLGLLRMKPVQAMDQNGNQEKETDPAVIQRMKNYTMIYDKINKHANKLRKQNVFEIIAAKHKNIIKEVPIDIKKRAVPYIGQVGGNKTLSKKQRDNYTRRIVIG